MYNKWVFAGSGNNENEILRGTKDIYSDLISYLALPKHIFRCKEQRIAYWVNGTVTCVISQIYHGKCEEEYGNLRHYQN